LAREKKTKPKSATRIVRNEQSANEKERDYKEKNLSPSRQVRQDRRTFSFILLPSVLKL